MKSSTPENSKKSRLPFLDTFWSLAEEDESIRTKAGYDLVLHCFPFVATEDVDTALNVNVDLKDAAYTLRRLLKGVCSGRAAARQGFASALSSFLMAAYSKAGRAQNTMQTVMKLNIESEHKESDDLTNVDLIEEAKNSHAWLREQLLNNTNWDSANEQNEGSKKKPSEERDHAFGRLFGILAVARSGCLVLAPEEVLLCYANDIANLYRWKKWMREVCCHAMIILLQLSAGDGGQHRLAFIVEEVVIKQLLTTSPQAKGLDGKELIQSWTPEQIALTLCIQKVFKNETNDTLCWPKILRTPILTAQTIAFMTEAFISTSQSYPRQHLVWSHVVAAVIPASKDVNHSGVLTSLDIQTVAAVFELVVEGGLMNTYERKALALMLLQNFANVLPPEHLSIFLRPKLCKLLLNTVVTGNKGRQHKLHRIGREVLDSIVIRVTSKTAHTHTRLVVAKRLLEVEPRFDSRTKTKTISLLLSPSHSFDGFVLSDILAFNEFLKSQMLQHAISGVGGGTTIESDEEETENRLSIHDAGGFLGVLCGLLPRLVSNLNEAEKHTAVEDVLSFLMACAFFDCSSCAPQKVLRKKERKVIKDKYPPLDSFTKASYFIADACCTPLTYSTQALCSAKFFSFLAECGNFAKLAVSEGKGPGDHIDPLTFKFKCLVKASSGWTDLEIHGTKLERSALDGDSLTSRTLANESCEIVRSLETTLEGDEDIFQKARCAKALASMVLVLSLQFLRCGDSDGEIHRGDDENYSDEIINDIIPDIVNAMRYLVDVNVDKIQKKKGEGLQPGNALMYLVDALVGALSISFDDKTRGASLRLFRDYVKVCWSTTLSYVAVSPSSFDTSRAISSLLDEVCGSDDERTADNGKDQNVSDESREDGSMSEDEGTVLSSDESAVTLAESWDQSEGVSGDNFKILLAADSGNEDADLDSAQLKEQLLHDVDDNLNELEHHAGADHALVQLIKLRQDNRKSAVQERERIDVARRIRCISLLDVLFSNKISNQLRSEDVGACVVRLLKVRRELEKTVSSPVTSSGQERVVSETRSLLEKVTLLLKTKVCKLKLVPLKTEESSLTLSNAILEELKISINAKQCDCCASALLFSLKLLSCKKERDNVANQLGDLAKEWGSDKASKIHPLLFEEIINRFPEIACGAMAVALIDVVVGGRNAFVKFEALRLLSSLISSESEGKVVESLKGHIVSLLVAVSKLFDGDEVNAKRARDALKWTESIVNFSKKHLSSDKPTWDCIRSLAPVLKKVKDISHSPAVKKSCDKIAAAIERGAVVAEEESGVKRKAGKITSSEKKVKKKKEKSKK